MKAALISDIHIHRIYFCRQEGEIRNRILHHFSAHKHQCTRWRTPRVFACGVRAEREMARWIRTEGEVMLNHFSNTAT